ncbi:M56 family metallopeptidase [Cytophagales bacterium LB-30]|uniref:M56 family metallopeptidase n=1 Tax=Shiella aurantiaca TaxID=3058365 RepID=A0ABT8F1C1_9BACT|nr:M56 family metallopeptidase [Shiella aurantiaca]MDN4164099.1 M56 family metallopeptidase [Shiella aurantiaca]
MDNLLTLILSQWLLGALLLGIYSLLLQEEKSYRFNRFYLLGSAVLMVLVPFVKWPSLGAGVNFLPTLLPELGISGTSFVEEQSATWELRNLLLIAYVLISAMLALGLLLRIGKLFHFIRKNKLSVKKHTGYYLVETQGLFPTSSFLHFLFWDNSVHMESHESDAIIQHELQHIKEKHSYDLLLLDLFRIVFWFNPIFYFIKRQLAIQHEYLADRQVLKHAHPADYQLLMVKNLFNVNPLVFSSPFNQSQLVKRMKMMQSNKTIQRWRSVSAVVLMAAGSVLVACQQNEAAYEEVVEIQQEAGDQQVLTDASDEIFQKVDKPASYPGGFEALREKIMEDLNYPQKAMEDKISGTVFVQFVVNKEGDIEDISIAKGVSPELDNEAIRFVSTMGKWIPGEHKGHIVKQSMILPVKFSLD